jgi:hypothetical protein
MADVPATFHHGRLNMESPSSPRKIMYDLCFFHIYVYLSILESEMILVKNIPNWILG